MNEDVTFVISFAEEQMKKTIIHAQEELAKIRAGKANPNMLDSLKVDCYGVESPLSQVANVNTPDSQTLAIQPWDKSMIEQIEKAIINANLGLNPQSDGTFVRINIPPLTEERRIELVKQAKTEVENCKISIRNFRREANEEIKGMVKNGLAEDEAKDAEDEVQALTDNCIAELDKLFGVKEKEIMTV